MPLAINILQADHGDAITIRATGHTDDTPYHILIDGGPSSCFETDDGYGPVKGPLQQWLDTLRAENQSIDLVVLSHIDDDHIGGLIRAYENERYKNVLNKKVWFNSGQLIARELNIAVPANSDIPLSIPVGAYTSVKQGLTLDGQLRDWQVTQRQLIYAGQTIPFLHGNITILSPSKEGLAKLLQKWERERPDDFTSVASDYDKTLRELANDKSFKEDASIPNESSIAFLIECGDTKALFLGDAHPTTICKYLRLFGYSEQNPLAVSLCKVAHHGSKANINEEMLSLVTAERYVISTNGSRHGLPNKKAIALIRRFSPTSSILFNYPKLIKRILLPEEQESDGAAFEAIAGEIFL